MSLSENNNIFRSMDCEGCQCDNCYECQSSNCDICARAEFAESNSKDMYYSQCLPKRCDFDF